MVIAVLVILLLVGGGVAVGIVLWVHQPWSNGWYGVEEKLKKMNGRSKYINYLTYHSPRQPPQLQMSIAQFLYKMERYS